MAASKAVSPSERLLMKQHRLLTILLAGSLLLLSACGGTSTLVFDNQTVCGTIQIELTNSQTNVTETYQVAMGQTLTIEITPNVTYHYVVDYSATGGNEAGYVCVAVHRGEVSVPPGASQKFNLTAVTPTPSPGP
ncbi:MAG: hypothetical protein Kow0063_02320 [Anaerolineae bacterium]